VRVFVVVPSPSVDRFIFISKAIIDRTASFVARSANPPQFEDKIRENQRSDPKFSFLNPADPYHAYYRHRVDKVTRGEVGEEQAQANDGPAAPEDDKPVVAQDAGTEPPPPEFILNIHNVTVFDLCVATRCFISTMLTRRCVAVIS
jgi:splicing factor 3A subunit 1